MGDVIPPTEQEFQERLEADRGALNEYYRSVGEGDSRYPSQRSDSPGYRLAPGYFQYYLEHRNSKSGATAAEFAFETWRRLTGVDQELKEALSRIAQQGDAEHDVREEWAVAWHRIATAVHRYFWRTDQSSGGCELMEHFARSAASQAGSATFLHIAARGRVSRNEIAHARSDCEALLRLDTRGCLPFVKRAAIGDLYDFDNLNIGQPAPRFTAPDLGGRTFDLEDKLGMVVILNFWTMGCPFCLDEYPYLKRCRETYSEDRLALVGICLDGTGHEVESYVAAEELRWPHIHEGENFSGRIAMLYNIRGIPSSYVIDRDGTIASKKPRADGLVQALASLLD